jgi:hypothetical protein
MASLTNIEIYDVVNKTKQTIVYFFEQVMQADSFILLQKNLK